MNMNLLNINKSDLIEQNRLIENWLRFLDVSVKTKETYTRSIKQYALYLLEHEIRNPERNDIIKFRNELAINHKPTTVNAYLMAVKQFYKWAVIEGYLLKDPTTGVKAMKLDKGFKKDYLTSSQVRKVLEQIDRTTLQGKRDYAIISLMVTTGLRTIEVVRADVDDLRSVADFTALFVQGKGRTEKTEYVKVSEEVETAIREYLNARGNTSGALFESVSNRNTGRMTTRSVSRIVKTYLQETGLNSDRLTAHSLRHTTATLNLLNGGTPEETMQLLRHQNINTTLIYSHALERANNNSELRVSGAIFNN